MISLAVSSMFLLAPSTIILTLMLQRAHLLSVILLLETLMLATALWALMTVSVISPFILILLLTPAVCEATLGLALFITLTRDSGSPLMKPSISSKW